MMRPTIAAALLLACLLAAASAVTAQTNTQSMGGQQSMPSTKFQATLKAKNTSANAQLMLSVDATAKTAKYMFSIHDVKNYIMSHIHLGAANVSGPPVVLLLPGHMNGSSNAIAGPTSLPTVAPINICSMTYTSTFAAADLIQFANATFTWDNFMSALRNGTLYGNIHTVEAPAGLIRGQLMPVKGMGGFDTTCSAHKP